MKIGVNKAIIVGFLGNDPDMKTTQSGKAVANVSIATTESWKDRQTGQQQERVEWHRVIFFDRLAEVVGQYLKKGSKVYVEGKLQTRSYDKDGVKHYSTEIIANEMQMLDGKQDNGAQQQSYAPQNNQRSASAQQQAPAFDDFSDPIPF